MFFQKYSSIESWTDEKHFAKVKDRYSDQEYVATEKIHGANFQFTVTGQIHSINVKCGKRTAYLEEQEQFYDWTLVRNKYLNDVVKLYKMFLLESDTIESVRVYGEIFGGDYPKELIPVKFSQSGECKSKPVQKGIYYCPFIDFLVFDIVLSYKNNETKFLTHDEILGYMTKMEKLRAVPIIFRGSFADVYKYCIDNVGFISTIPSLYGLKNPCENYAEGYVMKPNMNNVVGALRGILKIKHPKFDEMIGYDRNKKGLKKQNENDLNQGIFIQELEKYITQNRLNNVISKYGPSTIKPKLVGLLINDAKEDYIKTLDQDQDQELEKEWKNLYKSLIPICNKLNFTPTDI